MSNKVRYTLTMNREMLKYQILNLGIDPQKINNFEEKLDKILEKYYIEVKFNTYLKSKNKLMQMLIEGVYPSIEEWNSIAKHEKLLSHKSMEYISEKNWKKLRKELLLEIKDLLMED